MTFGGFNISGYEVVNVCFRSRRKHSLFFCWNLLSGDVISLLTQSLCFSLTLLMFIVVLFQALTLSETSTPGPITVCISELTFFFFFLRSDGSLASQFVHSVKFKYILLPNLI